MILLTGATGFLGSQLLIDLLNKNYKIVALKRSFSNTERIRKVLGDKKLNLVNIDLIDIPEILSYIQSILLFIQLPSMVEMKHLCIRW